MILALRTDQAVVELSLCDGQKKVAKKTWDAGRNLYATLVDELAAFLQDDFSQLSGIVVFRGPGSFTGLRIGIAVCNALAYAQRVPIVGTEGRNWLAAGLAALAKQHDEKIVLPKYGADARITRPKK